jgi:hypothetical protein
MNWTSKVVGFLAAAGAIFTLVFRTKLAEERADRAEETADRSQAITDNYQHINNARAELREQHAKEDAADAEALKAGRRNHLDNTY